MSKFKMPGKKTIVIVIIILALAAAAGLSFYKYYEAQKKIESLSTPQGQEQLAKQEAINIIAMVKKRMLLPEKEEPTLATVTDVEALKKNQAFFEKAKNGDKVLIYAGDKKAIIYRPSEDLIVNVGFISVSDENSQLEGTTQETTPITVEIRNGTSSSGLGQQIADDLKGNTTFTIEKVSDAKRKNYTNTIIVDLGTTTDKTSVNALAQSLDAQIVTSIPEGEATSEADVLVIIGANQNSN